MYFVFSIIGYTNFVCERIHIARKLTFPSGSCDKITIMTAMFTEWDVDIQTCIHIPSYTTPPMANLQ